MSINSRALDRILRKKGPEAQLVCATIPKATRFAHRHGYGTPDLEALLWYQDELGLPVDGWLSTAQRRAREKRLKAKEKRG